MATETQSSSTSSPSKKSWKLITGGIFALIMLVGIGGYFLFGVVVHQFDYSEGYRAGKIRKFSHKGYFFKTWEGEMVLETTGMAQEVFYFSVDGDDTNTIKAIEKAMLDGSRVNAHYEEKFKQITWQGDTKYFLDKIEVKP